MHKKIKPIIATTLVIGTMSSILPANSFMLGSVKAEASTYKNAGSGELQSLSLTWGSGNEIKLLDSYYGDKVDLSEDTEYYANIKSINGFYVSADVKGSGYVVKVFTSADKTEEGKEVGSYIKLNSSYEDIYLRIYKSEDAYKEAYNDGNVSDCEKTYVIHVTKSTVQSDTEVDREYAYLSGINLSEGDIDFSKNKTSYDVNVDEDTKKLTVRANPYDDEDYIEINGGAVYEDDNFEKTISLDKGNNTIEIYVEHEDEETTYTLNVYRGESSSTVSSNSENITIQSEGNSLNTWKEADGKWKYIDGTGAVLKNQWWFDKNTEINYYLKEDGYRATGWLYNNNNWYYFNGDGGMQTGWVNVDENWYYLNKSGIMKTGWLQDSNGKWYYLDSTGKMITNSNINGYNLGSDGALID